jgi:hypothetical protein
MITVTLLSPVVGDGTPGNAYRPQLSDDYPGLTWQDVTGQDTEQQPGDPALVVLEVYTDDPDALGADDTYFVMEIAENETEISE